MTHSTLWPLDFKCFGYEGDVAILWLKLKLQKVGWEAGETQECQPCVENA